MRLYLINPYNPHVTLLVSRESRWRRFFITRPLGLLSLVSVTPAEWKTTVVDENCIVPSYSAMPRPDLVGISMMTPQAPRAYELASYFRNCGVPVVLGGMHATTRPEEAMEYADSVVKGEADKIWPEVLEDVHRNTLKRVYSGGQVAPADIPPARHDLLPTGYAVASIQTARGCQLRCSFCSISALSGHRRRHRPIDDVVQELKSIREKNVVMVDENLIGFTDEDIARAKDLFHAIIKADLGKKWKAWVTINIADDDELLALAAQAGCSTAIIGFETTTKEGLEEIDKSFSGIEGRDFQASVHRIQRHKILVYGSFLIGLDGDERGVGKRLANVGSSYGLDFLSVCYMTPFPGTRLWERLVSERRIMADNFPRDWQFYTLSFPVACYRHLSTAEIFEERRISLSTFYSPLRILRRTWRNFCQRRRPVHTLLSNAMYFKRWRCGITLHPAPPIS